MQLTRAQACSMAVDDVQSAVQSDLTTGLTTVEAQRRLEHFGRNEMDGKEDDPLWKKYLEQFKDPMIILLMGSALISLLMGQYDDCFSIFLAITIVVTVAFVQEYKSEKALEALSELVPHQCHVMRDGKLASLMAAELVVGDLVSINVGDRVPADIRLVESVNLSIDESSLTGETKPRNKNTDQLSSGAKVPLADSNNMAFLGTLVRRGRGRGIVTSSAMNSEFGLIYKMMDEVEERKTPLQMNMDELGKKLSFLSFGIIGVILLIGVIQGRSLVKMFTISVSLAVAAIPEGLPIVVTVTLALGVMRMAKRNAIVKKLPAVEALGCTTVVCSDKTGTLTQNAMTARYIYTLDNDEKCSVSGTGYSVEGEVEGHKFDTDGHSRGIGRLLLASNLCNNANFRDNKIIGSPTEGALLVASLKFGMPDQREAWKRTEEIPFSSDTKWMAVKCERNGKETFFFKGSLKEVLARSKTVHEGEGRAGRKLSPDDVERLRTVAMSWAKEGYRVLAIAESDDMDNLAVLGLVAIADHARPGVDRAVAALQASRVRVCMITGDMRETAEAIARQLGFFDPSTHLSMSGEELEMLDAQKLAERITNIRVFYRTSPKHKMKIVAALQKNGEIVAMTGDGVNDAPALKLADIGVAMGIAGTDVAKEAADMILTDDNFATIMRAIEEGKAIAYNIRNFLRFQLSTSVAALSLITISTLMGFANPLNAMQILWINILMDGPPAQSLGVEPVQRDIMLKPPRKVTDPIITGKLIINVLIAASIIVSGTLYIFTREGEDGRVTRRDTTMTFTTFVFFDMFNALSCRSADKSLFEIGLLSNTFFLYAVGGSILGQLAVIYTPFLQEVFQTEALSLFDLVSLVLLTSSVWVVDEVRKFFRRRSNASTGSLHKRKTSDNALAPKKVLPQ